MDVNPFCHYLLQLRVRSKVSIKDRGYLRDENDIGLDFRTGLVLSFEEYDVSIGLCRGRALEVKQSIFHALMYRTSLKGVFEQHGPWDLVEKNAT